MNKTSCLSLILFSLFPLSSLAQGVANQAEDQFEDKLRVLYMKIYGDAQHIEIPELNDNDLMIINRSQLETPYSDAAFSAIQEACNYLDSEGIASADARYIAKVQMDAHRNEIADRNRFYMQLFDELSYEAKNYIVELIASGEGLVGVSSSFSELDLETYAENSPNDFNNSFKASCGRLPLVIETNRVQNRSPGSGIIVSHTLEEDDQ